MLVPRHDNRAGLTAGSVRAPANCVLLAADLHLRLIHVPGTYLPSCIARAELFLDKSDMLRVVRLAGNPTCGGENKKKAIVGTRRLDAEFADASGAFDSI